MSIELVMPENYLILSCPPLLLPWIFHSIRVFSSELALCIKWLRYWSFSFSFSISPSNEYSGLISFRIDWFEILAVQGNLNSLLQYHNSKASFLWHSAFFMVQTLTSLHDYWKNHGFNYKDLCRQKRNLCFVNILSRFVIGFLPRSKHLLISWLQSLSKVILEPKKLKSVTLSIVSPSIYHEVMGPDAKILVFWMLSLKPAFSLFSFSFIKRLFSSPSLFFHYRGIICISEIIDISSSNLASSLWFIQPGILHNVLCIAVL